ncbi:hypothetical protein J6590_043858 [Homalodisca vitripennis]|nr:hypothetical protein J6590_043858 [Homalodisca vitripennis]
MIILTVIKPELTFLLTSPKRIQLKTKGRLRVGWSLPQSACGAFCCPSNQFEADLLPAVAGSTYPPYRQTEHC